MQQDKLFLTLILLGLTTLVSACSGGALTASSWPGIAVDEDTAYVAYNTSVFAISLANGNLRWRFPTETDNNITFYSEPTITDDGRVLVGGYNNIFYSLDAGTGNEVWRFTDSQGRFIGGPLVESGRIYVPAADNSLYALDENGRLRWKYTTEDPLWSRPASNGDEIYLTSMDHNLYALEAESGRLIWSQSLGGAIVGTPSLSQDGMLYVGTLAKQMLAVETRSGNISWQADTDGWIWSGPALDGDRLYFGDLAGYFYAIDRNTGVEIWRMQPDGPIAGTPLVTDEAIYFTTEVGSLVAVSHEASVLWTQPIGGRIYTRPVLAGDLILVAPIETDPLVVAVDLNGSHRWSFAPTE